MYKVDRIRGEIYDSDTGEVVGRIVVRDVMTSKVGEEGKYEKVTESVELETTERSFFRKNLGL